MKVSWKHLYCYFKRLLGFESRDHWDDNPFVIL